MSRCPPGTKCRGVIPALSHIMLQSDDMAREFNDILNGVEIFAPFQPLDPAIVFYAPLRNSVRDLRLSADTFSRDSEAWYLDASGIYRRVPINGPRFENSRLLMEGASTNKCENYNANPDPALTNVSPGAATASLVAAPAELLALGLSDICSDGNVIELHNQGGGPTNAGITGSVGNLNAHVVSAWMNTFGSVVEFGVSDNRQLVSTVGWERVTVIATPTGTWNTWQIRLDPGERVQFILNQLEEQRVATSPIVTLGTAGQRAIDRLEYAGADQFVSDVAGTVLLKWTPEFSDADVNNDVRFEFLGLPGRARDRWGYFFKNSAGDNNFVFLPESGASGYVDMTTPVQIGQEYKIAYRWGAGFNDSGYYDGGIVWGPEDRGYTSTNPISLMHVVSEPFTGQRVSDIQIFNEKKSRAWIEENFFQS